MTTSLENKANKFLSELLNSNNINKEIYNMYKTKNSNPPRIYGLVKAHKSDHPLRPVVSYIGSPLYNISKLMAEYLNTAIPTSKFSLKNSYEFVNKIQGVTIS